MTPSTKRVLYGLYRRLLMMRARFQCHLNGGTVKWNQKSLPSVFVRIDGLGTVEIDEQVAFGFHLAPKLGNGEILLQARTKESRILIKKRTQVSNNAVLIASGSIVVGEDCLIGDLVRISDSDGHVIDPASRLTCSPAAPVTIEKNVWIGARVMVLKGVTIGENSIVAAGAVVTKSIPANCIAGGVPARVIRTI